MSDHGPGYQQPAAGGLAGKLGERPRDEPCMIIVYGPSGLGKTADLIATFPLALFLAVPKALEPSKHVFGWAVPRKHIKNVRTLHEANALLKGVAALPPERRPSAIVVDDISLLTEQTLRAMELSGRYSNGFAKWGELRNLILDFCRLSRHEVGAHVALNGHEFAPRTDDDGFWAGGPLLPSKKLVAKIPHTADTVLRAGYEPGRKPWPGVYRVEADPRWFMKDRHGHTGTLPMNLRALLTNAGYTLGYPRGMEWVGDIAQKACAAVLAGAAPNDVAQKVYDLAKDRDRRHVNWGLRDGFDLAVYKQSTTNNQELSWG